jgi:hypothetical protein
MDRFNEVKTKNMRRKTQALVFKYLILLGFVSTLFGFSNSHYGRVRPKQVWKIEKIIYDYYKTQNSDKEIVKSGIETNAGTFIFNGDSTGSYSYAIDKIERKGEFKQSTTSSRMFSYAIGMNQNELVVRNFYIVLEEESDEMEMRVSELTVSRNSRFTVTATFYLSK